MNEYTKTCRCPLKLSPSQFFGVQSWWRTVTAAGKGISGMYWERCSHMLLSSSLSVSVSKRTLKSSKLISLAENVCHTLVGQLQCRQVNLTVVFLPKTKDNSHVMDVEQVMTLEDCSHIDWVINKCYKRVLIKQFIHIGGQRVLLY